jgi:muramoyltetrapeptide carboxypeptidase
VVEPPSLKPSRGYLAGSDRARLESLRRLWRDEEVHGFIARRGGYGCQRLLGRLGAWAEAPEGRPIIGFSDLTALHLARYKAAGAGGWHADMADGLADLAPPELKAFLDGLSGRGPRRWDFEAGAVLRPPAGGKGRRAVGRGPLLGGNLATIAALLGSPWLPSFDGAILMLEEVNESGYRLDRLFCSLLQSSAFGQLQGLVFGGFSGCGSGAEVARLQREAAARLPKGAPAVRGAPFGHGDRNWPWWVGEEAELEAGEGGAALRFLGR